MSTPFRAVRRPAVLAIAGAGPVGGLAVGGTALAATGTHSPTHRPSAPASAAPQTVHVFAHYARGQTFGSELDATDLAHAPDLIAAYATNGKLGYVLKQQLHPPGPANPAAALRAQAAAARQAPPVIPVYAVDGVTQIGVFQFAPTGG
jgi:hypothetical protein